MRRQRLERQRECRRRHLYEASPYRNDQTEPLEDIPYDAPQKIAPSEPLDAAMHVEWLQGATARNLKYEYSGNLYLDPDHLFRL